MRGRRVFVADGHHRYETALMYRDSVRLQHPESTGHEGFNFVPVFFANMSDPGLVILPTHRLVHHFPKFDRARLIDRMRARCSVQPLSGFKALREGMSRCEGVVFGLVVNGEPGFFLVRPLDNHPAVQPGLPDVLTGLDVTILHNDIIAGILGMSDEDQQKKRYLEYEHDAGRAAEIVMQGNAQAAFLMNATRVDQVRAVAEAGFTLPQKSTYFYPKLLSGLVMYSFEDQLP